VNTPTAGSGEATHTSTRISAFGSPPNGFQERPWFITCHGCYLPCWHLGLARQARSSRVYPAPGQVMPPARLDGTARTLQGMARVRSGQAPAWPLSSGRSVRRGSRVQRDFACTFTRHFSPVPVVLRSQSRLRLEGRTRTLSGPSPDLSPARTLAPSARRAPGPALLPAPTGGGN
jgi:hypothetical protein